MSQDAIEIARAAFEAWNRGDREAWIDYWAEDAEFYPLRAQLEGRVYEGRTGARRFVEEVDGEWQDLRFDVDELRGVGGHVVALLHIRARGVASGVEIDVPGGLVGTVRDGSITYARFYSDPAAALEAAGPGPSAA